MIDHRFFRSFAVCMLASLLAVQTPLTVLADEEIPVESYDTTEVTDPAAENPVEEAQPVQPDSGSTDGGGENQPDEAVPEVKEVLPISTDLSVSGEAGDLMLLLTVTNASFISEQMGDLNAVFAGIPEGVTVSVAGQTENTITYHIQGNAAVYTKTDLVMSIPGGWLKNTADETVGEEIKIEGHDLCWFAHADFGIRLKSKAETKDNASWIAEQPLVENSADYDSLHFVYQEMKAKSFGGETDILEYPSEDARIVGRADKEQSVYEIVDVRDGWVYVESGRVRGFVRKEQIVAAKKETKYRRPDTAKEVIPSAENKALCFVRITGNNPLVKEDPRITLKDTEIKEAKEDKSRTVGTVSKDGLVYWLCNEGEDWMYVESGEVRGFVRQENFLSVKDTQKRIEKEGTEGLARAEKTLEPSENQAFYYKLISVKAGDPEGINREMIVQAARAYIGNPYVYGGTDPVHGIDCSAFMQFLFGTYGIALPRTSKEQGFAGKMIPMDSVDRGDVIIYADDAEIYHVVLSAGGGKTVEAADETQGIVSKEVNQANAVWGISLLDDVKTVAIPAVIEKPEYSYETQEAYETRLKEEKRE